MLTLAREGRLVMGEEADEVIASLERTLEQLRLREQGLKVWDDPSLRWIGERYPAVGRFVVDSAFSEQVSPGLLAQALRELPKYVEAFRIARRGGPAEDR
ncbi:hypothetical protein CKY47_35310 [Saccharothrix yanglingensis]|uniref:Uncharacterized protein n=2 Tax=Saccharothrix yanglingensis TaxID=659496 RepID=A0ABU0XAF8_9PSEU|nr:hypothetical protein [Saccharothrix yanglingensis]